MKKAITVCVIIILICNSASAKKQHHHARGKYAFHDILLAKKNGASYVVTDNDKKRFDKSMASFNAKSNNIGQNSNAINTKPQATVSTSFNHTDAIVNVTKSFGNFTFGGSWQQKVAGTDSVASLLDLDGIETGSIVKLQFQYTSYKLTEGNIINLAPGFFTNAQFTYNPASNKYTTDSVTLKQVTTTNTNFSGKIVAGYHFELTDIFGMSVSAGYENGTSYTPNGATSFYTSFGKSPNYYLASESFGAPKYQNISVLSADIAAAVINLDKTSDTVKGYSFACDLYCGYSFALNKYAILLPIYLINGTEDKIAALNGGIRFGYSWVPTSGPQPANTGFTAEVFISTPFNIFGGGVGR